jgi:hypothetical protein
MAEMETSRSEAGAVDESNPGPVDVPTEVV